MDREPPRRDVPPSPYGGRAVQWRRTDLADEAAQAIYRDLLAGRPADDRKDLC